MTFALDDLIHRFRYYVEDRQIGLAENMGQHFEDSGDQTPFKQSGYVILSIASAYFEMIQQFIKGKESVGQSLPFFKAGFKAVYPSPEWTDQSIKKIYKVIRCGMYHGGMPRIGCHLSRYFQPGFHICRDEIHVNPAAVVRDIQGHFEGYIKSITTNQIRRDNFIAMCNLTGLDQDSPDHTYCDTPGGTVFTPTTSDPGREGTSLSTGE